MCQSSSQLPLFSIPQSPEFTKHEDTKPWVQRASKRPGKPGPHPQGSVGSCSAPPSPAEPSTSQHSHQLAPTWGNGGEQPHDGGWLQRRMLRRGTNPTSTCSATAEAADVMKKTIHEEIITLQNYFKSMRAKTDVGGEAGDRLLSLQVSCHLCNPPSTRRAGGPQTLLLRGLREPREKCSRTAKPGPETASFGLRCRCSRDGLRLAPNLPDPETGGVATFA